VLHELLASADVFLTSLRPGALSRLGLARRRCATGIPVLSTRAVMASEYAARMPTSLATTARRSGRAAEWDTYLLRPTVSTRSVSARDRRPKRRYGTGFRHRNCAAQANENGRWFGGRRVPAGHRDVDAVFRLAGVLNGGEAGPVSGRGPQVNPLTGNYRTKDGRHIQLMFLQGDRYWAEFCRVVGREDLIEDPRFVDLAARRANGDACVAELDSVFARRTLVEWKELLAKLDAPWAPVQSVAEVIEDPQVIANGYVGEVRLDEGQTYRLPAVPVQLDEQRHRCVVHLSTGAH